MKTFSSLSGIVLLITCGQAMALDITANANRDVNEVEIGGEVIETTYDRIRIEAVEHGMGPLWPGVHGGYLNTVQTNQSTSSSETQQGYFVGGSLQYNVNLTEELGANARLRYTYNETSGESGGSSTDTTWGETVIGAQAVYRLNPLRLKSGVDYQTISGEQVTTTGSTETTADIEGAEGFTFTAGADLQLGSGVISAYWQTGARNSYGFNYSQSISL